VTRRQLPQRAGSLGLNGGGTAAAVPPFNGTSAQLGYTVPFMLENTDRRQIKNRHYKN